MTKTERCILEDAVTNGVSILFPHAMAVVDRMHKSGLVTFRRVARMYHVKATEKGALKLRSAHG